MLRHEETGGNLDPTQAASSKSVAASSKGRACQQGELRKDYRGIAPRRLRRAVSNPRHHEDEQNRSPLRKRLPARFPWLVRPRLVRSCWGLAGARTGNRHDMECVAMLR